MHVLVVAEKSINTAVEETKKRRVIPPLFKLRKEKSDEL